LRIGKINPSVTASPRHPVALRKCAGGTFLAEAAGAMLRGKGGSFYLPLCNFAFSPLHKGGFDYGESGDNSLKKNRHVAVLFVYA